MKEEDLLGWLIHQKRHSEIPEITDEMKDKLIETTKYLAVIFCMYKNYKIKIENRTVTFSLKSDQLQTTRTTNKTFVF